MQIISKTENELVIESHYIKSGITFTIGSLLSGAIFFEVYRIVYMVNHSIYLMIISITCLLFSIFGFFSIKDILVTVTKDTISIRTKTLFTTKEKIYPTISLQKITLGYNFLMLTYANKRIQFLGFFPNNQFKIGLELAVFLHIPFYPLQGFPQFYNPEQAKYH